MVRRYGPKSSSASRGSARRSRPMGRSYTKRRSAVRMRTGAGVQKSFVTSYVGASIALVAGTNQFPVFSVTEQALVNATAFAALYDEFTITKFEVKLIPQFNVAGQVDQVLTPSTGGTPSFSATGITRMHSEVNKSVNCQPATQENDILVCNDARTDYLDKVITLKCNKPTPWLFSGATTGAATTAVAARQSGTTWLDVTSGTGITWGAIRSAMIPPGVPVGSTAGTQYYHVIYKVWVTYREQI